VEWDNDEQTVIRYDFEWGWHWDEFVQVSKHAFALIATVEHQVNLIFNLRDSRVLPEGMTLHMREVMSAAPTQLGYIVVATDNPLVDATFSVLGRVHQSISQRLVTVPSLGAARTALLHPYSLGQSISPAKLVKA
jgi:hypothetical protein